MAGARQASSKSLRGRLLALAVQIRRPQSNLKCSICGEPMKDHNDSKSRRYPRPYCQGVLAARAITI